MTDGIGSPAVGEPQGPSKGVALTNWLVSKTSGLLERKTSRRGFLIGSAMAGSAVAVTGCQVATQPGSPYVHITDCGPSFCTDGWTEFCCAVSGGYNKCPSGSFPGGWWRADFSSFCNGTRYYIDCMQSCCGPLRGDGFCAGCEECRCAGGCGTRRVYCNYFRYGQCHTEVAHTGPIACRVVTCVPPYQSDPACINSPAVDNRTAEHAPNCIVNLEPGPPPPPPPPPPRVAGVLPSSCALVVPASGGELLAAARGFDGGVGTRTLLNGAWTPWFSIGGQMTSGLAAAAAGSADYVVGRGTDNAIWVNRRVAMQWSGWNSLGGGSRSDPVAVTDGNAIRILVRGMDDAVYANRYDGSSSGWFKVGGGVTSDPSATPDTTGIRTVARGYDDKVYTNHYGGGVWSGWSSLGGIANSNPAIVSTSGGTYAFIRGINDLAVWVNRFDGSTWSGWVSLGGSVSSDPAVSAHPSGIRVFARGLDNAVYMNYLTGSTWSGWGSLGGATTADPVAIADATGSSVFIRGTDGALWYGQLVPGWTGWHSLAGFVVPVRAGV